jgi:DNA-binding MarR family transcriptional regulator
MDRKLSQAVDTVARECIAVRVRMLNRVVSGYYDEGLRPLGLKISQANILVVAAKLGRARPPEVCGLLHLDPSTLSRNVERMVARGWLETLADDDGRSQPFRITAKGTALLRKALPGWRAAQRRASTLLGEQGVALLHELSRELMKRPDR